jgi:two-component system nitrate/nitrite response regulator NarP
MARILIISDQPVLRCGFDTILAANGFGVLMAPTAVSRSNPAGALRPDLTLLDAAAGLNFEELSELHRRMPHCPVVLWTDAIPLDLVFRALEFGVRGIVERRSTADQLVGALARVASGEMQIGLGATVDRPARGRAILTPREKELVACLRRGMRNKQIAARMNITEGTVKVFLFRLYQKLGVRNRFELASCGPVEDIVPAGSAALAPVTTATARFN